MVLFKDPKSDLELLGFVAGFVRDFAIRTFKHADDEDICSLLAIILVEGYDPNEKAYGEVSPVFLFSNEAAKSILKV